MVVRSKAIERILRPFWWSAQPSECRGIEWSSNEGCCECHQKCSTWTTWGILPCKRFTSSPSGGITEFLEVSEDQVYRTLKLLNPTKACGPDRIPNWLLKEYAKLLVVPVTRILDSSYKEQRLPWVWKLADVSPLPKKKPVKEIKKDLCPISLTPCMSKIADGYVVDDFIKPAALQVLDDWQYGAVLKSTTTLALLEMLDSWTKATDGNRSTIRTVLFACRKAFDLIDHGILVNKLKSLNLPVSIINWVIDFLSDHQIQSPQASPKALNQVHGYL